MIGPKPSGMKNFVWGRDCVSYNTPAEHVPRLKGTCLGAGGRHRGHGIKAKASMAQRTSLSRRGFLRGVAAAAVPAIVPASVFGAGAPSSRIAVGCIGVGRMGMVDLKSIMGSRGVQIVAVCDVDSNRMNAARSYVNARTGTTGCGAHGDFRDLTARDDIDAVQIATPDHWHALPAVAAARAGKDVFVQKPLTLTIAEGRVLSDTIRRYGLVLQVGSQQRSDQRFRFACELVRNGRIGKLHTVKVGISGDPACGPQPVMPVPENLNYEMWLGPAPMAPYTQARVHPQKGYGRPGWLRIRDYGAGMITGWGAHHMDIAHWGMGAERCGPLAVEGRAQFPADGLWDVHGAFGIDYLYAGGVRLNCSNRHPNGVRFEGADGWVFVSRGRIDAGPKSLLKSVIGPSEVHLYKSPNHKANFLDCIRSRRRTVAPVEIGHRSCTACLLGDMAMRTGRKLKWDPKTERFSDDDQANGMLDRAMRAPWRL